MNATQRFPHDLPRQKSSGLSLRCEWAERRASRAKERERARERSPAVAACRVSRIPTKFYVTCKCARRECGRVTCLFLSVSLVFSLPVSFYRRSGTYETSFGVDRRLSVSLSRYGRRIFFFHERRASPSPPPALPPQVQKYYHVVAKAVLFLSLSLSLMCQSPPRVYPLGNDGGCWLQELLYEFRHARRRDALPAGSAFVFVAQGPVAPSFLKQYNLRNLVGDEYSFSSPLALPFPTFRRGARGLNRRGSTWHRRSSALVAETSFLVPRLSR